VARAYRTVSTQAIRMVVDIKLAYFFAWERQQIYERKEVNSMGYL